mgnify:CR=1 FL=1
MMKLKSMHDFLVEVGVEIIIGLVIALLAFILRFQRRIIERFYAQIITKRWEQMAKVNELLSDLANELEVLYVHLIKYHDGDGIPSGTKVTRLTILWEEVGRKINIGDQWVLPRRVSQRISR